MSHYLTGTVTAVVQDRAGLQRIEVDGAPAVVLTALTGPVALGDRVVVSAVAERWGLGSSEGRIVHWNLERQAWTDPAAPPPEERAGITVKARYTSVQAVGPTAEEREGGPPGDLGGLPVVGCHLHSQLAPVVAGILSGRPRARVAYVMTDAAALPLALSDAVASLRGSGALVATVTAGQAFGGDHEAVTTASGIQLAAAGADVVVVGPGPGAAGSASRLGFGGLELAGLARPVRALNGVPVLAVRASEADPRPRHRGVSHHTRTVLELSGAGFLVATPQGADAGFVAPPHEHRPVTLPPLAALAALVAADLATMGRGPDEDPTFFLHAAAAGALAATLAGAAAAQAP